MTANHGTRFYACDDQYFAIFPWFSKYNDRRRDELTELATRGDSFNPVDDVLQIVSKQK
ncbi:MAG: hypothetical protein IPJ39_22355 [Saprospiraceae bacterium]|nr:hypothetical protein [Saprospiraceae bacterium]